MTERVLQRVYLLLGIAATGYTLYITVKMFAGHDRHNRTDEYCFTCDKAI